MNPDVVIDLLTRAFTLILIISAPILVITLLVGLVISIFQAVTAIQEMTLTFIPKIFVVIISLLFFFPWIIRQLITYTYTLWGDFTPYIGKF